MLFHCDALGARYGSPKFASLVNFVHFDRVHPDYVFELAVLLATPGLRPVDLRNWFDRRLQIRTIRFVQRLCLPVRDLPRANAASVSEADAWTMLSLTPVRSTPSVWARALIVQEGVHVVARRLGVAEKVVRRWSHRTAANTVA